MILKLFEAQLFRLAAAIARKRGAAMHAEAAGLASVAATVEGSVIDLFEAAGLSPAVAEIAAKAYAAGWNDGAHRAHGVTLADAVLDREQPYRAMAGELAPLVFLN